MQRQGEHQWPPGWPHYREATRLYLFDLIVGGNDVKDTIDTMRDKEKAWIASNRHNPNVANQ